MSGATMKHLNIPTLEKGWCEYDTLLRHAVFAVLVKFIDEDFVDSDDRSCKGIEAFKRDIEWRLSDEYCKDDDLVEVMKFQYRVYKWWKRWNDHEMYHTLWGVELETKIATKIVELSQCMWT